MCSCTIQKPLFPLSKTHTPLATAQPPHPLPTASTSHIPHLSLLTLPPPLRHPWSLVSTVLIIQQCSFACFLTFLIYTVSTPMLYSAFVLNLQRWPFVCVCVEQPYNTPLGNSLYRVSPCSASIFMEYCSTKWACTLWRWKACIFKGPSRINSFFPCLVSTQLPFVTRPNWRSLKRKSVIVQITISDFHKPSGGIGGEES